MGLMAILQYVLSAVPLRKTQRNFLTVLLSVFLAVPGRLNVLNLSRYAACSESTIRRWLHRSDPGAIPWGAVHRATVSTAIESGLISPLCVLAIDASFHRKSGQHTAHLGSFWNGCAARTERGIEQSCCALIDVQHRQAFTVDVRQTRTGSEAPSRLEQAADQLDDVLLDLQTVPRLDLAAVVADGNYAKESMVETVTGHGLPFISRFPRNANLKYLYTGEHPRRRGRPKKFDGKVDFSDLQRFDLVSETSTERVWTQVVWSVQWAREVRAVVIQQVGKKGQVTG